MKLKLLALILLLSSGSVLSNDLNKMEDLHLGTRLATVRVCSDLAVYTKSWKAMEIFNAYDKKATKYIETIKDTKKLDAILQAMSEMQLSMMNSTGKFNWNTSCRSAIENYKDNSFL